MSRTSLRSNAGLPLLFGRRVPRPSRGDGWNALADIEVFVVAVEAAERIRQVGPDKAGAKGSYTIYRIAEGG